MKEYKRSMTTILTALLFAAVVVLMRVDRIPSVFRVESPALVFLTSDFFVLVGAGLCGWRGGISLEAAGQEDDRGYDPEGNRTGEENGG